MKKIPVGTIIAGKYRVVSGPCESGGTYVIYKVHHIDWDMDISMKIPREDVFTDKNDMEAIVRECGLWTELGANPYINSCYYVREIDGRPVIFSEWTEGQSLDAFISSGRLYEGSETEVQLKILDISIQILYGLRFAHSHVPPVIHGDVKPDNIIIAENGDVKLTDFGLSASGRGGFTDKFCSPEQKNGAAVTVSSDMYSWAVTVLAMYSGRMTWDDGIEAGVCCNEIFSSCRITPTEDIQAFLKLCLDTDPEKRTDICTACSSLIHRYESSSLGGRKYEQVYLQNDDQSDEIADFLNNRAICFLDNGEEEKAVEYWQKALGYMPRHPESMYNYGVYLVGTGSLYYKELCRQLREENVRDCDDYISEIRRTYSISIAGGINCCPEKILFNKDGKSILCVDGRAKVYDTVNFSLICEYDCFDDVPGSDGWVCIKSSPKDDSIAVRAVNNRACLYKKGCRLCDFVLPTDSLRYSFSPDGALFAVSDGIEYVTVYKMPENDRCRPSFNKTASCAELIQYQKRYDSCIAEFLNAMNKQNYAAALSAIDKMAQIPFLGKGPYYFGQKKKLAKFCKKTAPSVFCIKESDIRIKTAAFSYDSAYIAAACDDVFYVLIAEDLECLCKSAVESGSIISQLEFDSSLSKLYIYTEKGKKSHRLVFDIESRRIESSSVLKERPRLSVDCIPEEIDALLPEGVHCCMSPDEFSVLVWDECSCRIFHLDHELIYENRTPFPAAFLSKDKAGLFGACDKNAFLFDMLTEEQLEHFKALSEIKLENPSIRFSNDAKKAKEYLDAFEDFAPSHSDPRIRYMIECSDEEYEELMNECKRQSSFWDDKTVCSFLSLFMRTLQLGPEKADKEAQSSDVNPEAMLKAEKIPHTSAKEKRRTELTQMAKRIHDMRETLLKTVLGQEHAVHVVAEGLFNAEVLAASDTSRKRPRAVFTFAGPPGVGKTYLAEQAAELLGIPYKRFDMSEFSDEHAYEGLIGFDYTWKNSSPGKLTSFVKDNPHCILLFDEFEKSHKKTIQIFYQLLDAGIVTDRYLETRKIAAENNVLRQEDEGFSADALTSSPHVSFRDTIIIFTTNAGRSLYENDISGNNSGISAKMLLNALETEIDPLTNAPYFPSAVVSRMATGYPLLFNHLMPHHLVGIIENEYNRFRELIKNQYNININADKNVLLALLYSAGGCGDARSVGTTAANFFRTEFYKLVNCRADALENIRNIYFRADTKHLPQNIAALFDTPHKTELLIYGSELLIRKLTEELPEYVIHGALSVDEAVNAAQKENISFVIIDISHKSIDSTASAAETDPARTIMSSMAAKTWHDGKVLFGRLMDNAPEMPIYLLETPQRVIDDELLSGFVRLGARGKISMLSGDNDNDGLTDRIAEISHELYMQNIAADLAQQHKALTFETAPKYLDDDLLADMCGFELERVVDADDVNGMLTDSERPKERFDDVIGAGAAKKELRFFVDYLKDPRKYMAQGHRLPKGILLYGKPGTGKTMLAKAMAGESDITFIPAAASSFVNRYAGSGPAAVRELFRKARRYAPSIIFIDEVDAIAKQRTGDGFNETSEETLNALLIEMDGFSVDPKRPVFVIAATNFEADNGRGGKSVLDEAFVRRFDRKIRIELPNKEERKQLLELLISRIPKHSISEAMIESIASRSLGMSPAILTNVVESARRTAFDLMTEVNDAILEEAYEQTKYGEKKDWGEKYLLRVARHETGHAIINYLCGNTPGYLTIEARSNAGGYMEFSEEQRDSPMMTRSQLIDRIRVDLGGRAAEIMYYGESEGISTGPSGDLESATNTALSMLIYFGMDKEFGIASVDRKTAMNDPEIRKRVSRILDEELTNSIRILNDNKDLVDALVDELLKKNRLTGSEISELLQKVRSTVKT